MLPLNALLADKAGLETKSPTRGKKDAASTDFAALVEAVLGQGITAENKTAGELLHNSPPTDAAQAQKAGDAQKPLLEKPVTKTEREPEATEKVQKTLGKQKAPAHSDQIRPPSFAAPKMVFEQTTKRPNKTVSNITSTKPHTEEKVFVSHTLALLEKTPEVVLLTSEGLRKLGEKIGHSLLAKVHEKLNERKNSKPHGILEEAKKPEPTKELATTKLQKTGSNAPGVILNTEEKITLSAKKLQRPVSRETGIPEKGAEPEPRLAAEIQPPKNNSPERPQAVVLGRSMPQVEIAPRSEVQPPRPELVRQFHEVFNRAQVLVQDSQNAQFSVRLYPRELGRMEIELRLVDGEIRGKIVVASEEVKNEMQNFLKNREDFHGVEIEVRSENRNAHAQRSPDELEEEKVLLTKLITERAAQVYTAEEILRSGGNALYA